MLTRRTNVLLTETDYTLLSQLADKKHESIGKLIRKAVRDTYGKSLKNSRKDVLSEIEKLSSKINAKGIDYKKLITSGRKY